jgi:hypothetical protein
VPIKADNPSTMKAIAALFPAVKLAVRAFFKQDLKLQRGGTGVRLVLADRIEASRPLSRTELLAQKEKADLQGARDELARVLDVDPRSRSSLRHLAFVEHALEKKGWRGLYKMPLPILQKGLEQLEELVSNWSPVGLACLRSKMAVAVIDRERQGGDKEADATRNAVVLDNPEEVAAEAIEIARGQVEEVDDAAALLAAYSALGTMAPSGMAQIQSELGSGLDKAVPRESPAPRDEPIKLRDLQQS